MNLKSEALEAAANALKLNTSFLIAGHVNPDGDCLGCMCALGIALHRLGKKATMVSPDGVPEMYKFLPCSGSIIRGVPEGSAFDVAIAVDCEGLDRTGSVEDAMRCCERLIEIDHHPGDRKESAISLVDASAAATGEIVLPLFKAAGVRVDADIALCLLAAIVTDTGSFRFGNVRPSTFRAAAELIEAGASPSDIARHVYETRSYSSTKLLGLALSTLQTTADGRIAWASITRNQMTESSASEAETEGIVNYVVAIRGAQVGLLFREGPDNTTRVSLRSRDGLEISQVARLFGGGGHAMAAGCTVERPLADAEGVVLSAVRKWMGY